MTAEDQLKSVLMIDLLDRDAAPLHPEHIDWTAVVSAAAAEDLLPALNAAVHRAQWTSAIPNESSARMRRSYAQAMHRAVNQQQALRAVLERFVAAGVSVAVLKGAALSALLYRDPTTRPMLDIDLLVPADALANVHAILIELGYDPGRSFMAADFVQQEEGEMSYVRRTPPAASIDLHWHVFTVPGYAVGDITAWFWSQCVEEKILGQPVRVFADEALLLHLAAHNYVHHTGRSLKRMLDVALLLHRRGATLDADLLWRGAHTIGMSAALHRMLAEVQQEWGVPTDALAAQASRIAALPSAATITVTDAGIAALQSPLRHLMIGASMSNLGRGIRYVFRQVFPYSHYLRTRYGMQHDWQAPYYYALRIGRGVAQVVRWLGKSRESE